MLGTSGTEHARITGLLSTRRGGRKDASTRSLNGQQSPERRLRHTFRRDNNGMNGDFVTRSSRETPLNSASGNVTAIAVTFLVSSCVIGMYGRWARVSVCVLRTPTAPTRPARQASSRFRRTSDEKTPRRLTCPRGKTSTNPRHSVPNAVIWGN